MSTVWEKQESGTEYTSSESDGEGYSSASMSVSSNEAGEENADELTSLEESWASSKEDGQFSQGALLFSKQELLRRHQLKKHVERLESAVKKKEDLVNSLRKKSFRCQEQQCRLSEEKSHLEEAMTGYDKSCLGMFHGRISKIVLDIETEKELEEELKLSLSKAEKELLEAQIAVGHFDQCKNELEVAEMAWKEFKDKQFGHRLQAENNLVANAKRKDGMRERKLTELREQQAAANSVIEEWKKASKQEKAFLQTALNQHKAAKAKEAEERHKLHLEKRMKAILSLKDNIASSEGTIQAKLLLKQEQARKQQAEKEEERKRVIEENGIPEEYFLRQKRVKQFQDMLEQFKRKQEERRFDIIEKLVKEEKLNKKIKKEKKQLQERSFHSKASSRKMEQTLTPHNTTTDISTVAFSVNPDTTTTISERLETETVTTQQDLKPRPPSGSTSDAENIANDVVERKLPSMVVPEIRGLWEPAHPDKGAESPGGITSGLGAKEEREGQGEGTEGGSGEERGRTTMKKTASKATELMMEKAMDKLRKSRVTKQIAAGREFKGQPFCSKPQVVLFKNFDVGKVYSKRVKLTNVSYTVNRCYLEKVSDDIANFVTVMFDPPGSMSAGMSCNMHVTFSPQLNEDLNGKIHFTSQSGDFAVPVRCETKRCVVSVDRSELKFGLVHVGETVRQRVTVLNAGALGTQYTIAPALDSPSAPVPPKTSITHTPPVPTSELVRFDLNSRSIPSDPSQHSSYSVVSNVETLVRPDSSSGQGILVNKCLKSKSTGHIEFSPFVEERQGGRQEVKGQDKTAEEQEVVKKPPSREKKSRPHTPKKSSSSSRNTSGKTQSEAEQGQGKSGVEPKHSKSGMEPKQSKSGMEPKQSKSGMQSESEMESRQSMSEIEPGQSKSGIGLRQSKEIPKIVSQEEGVGSAEQGTARPESRDKETGLGHQDATMANKQDSSTEVRVVTEDAVTGVSSSSEQQRASRAQLDVDPTPAIQVGGAPVGTVPPFGSKTIELVFAPLTVARHVVKFNITFTEPSATPLEVTASGDGTDQPVYVEQEEMDFRICMLGRLYQSSVILHNRAPTALQVTFQVPSDLQPYLEVLPKHGVVQGESPFAAQLKFTPSKPLLEPPLQDIYHTPTDGLFRMPVQVGVASQSQPVSFLVLAHVTPSDLFFEPKALKLGCCTTQESVVAVLSVTNSSSLPQKFGFIDPPACVDIQPNDGFGELLPNETVKLDVIFSARKPMDYEFTLVCKSGLDKTYRIPCEGRGILSPLELSHNSIHFLPTPLGITSTATFTLTNKKLSRLNSAVIRGTAPPQGTKAFQFSPPAGAPISLSPQVGLLPVGKTIEVEVQFSPCLSEEMIREEALRLSLARSSELCGSRQEDEGGSRMEGRKRTASTSKKRKSLAVPTGTGRSSLCSSVGSLAQSGVSSRSEHSSHVAPEPRSEQWLEAYFSLMQSFTDECTVYDIPCFVSKTIPTDKQTMPTCHPDHTLYLSVTTPTIRPSLMLKDGPHSNIDFGNVGIGDFATKKIAVQNISSSPLSLTSSLLDPCGPFQLRNALRDLQPDESHQLLLRFAPHGSGKVYDSLTLCGETTPLLELRMTGTGVQPQVDVSLGSGEDLCLDMGHAMARDVVSKTFTLHNSSPLQVRFRLSLDSQQPKVGPTKSFRACNYNGQPPFACIPLEGVVEAEGKKEIQVTFSPDHQSKAYSDKLRMQLNEHTKCHVSLSGCAWSNNMYVSVLDDSQDQQPSLLVEDKDSMIPTLPDQEEPPTPLLLMFTHLSEGTGTDSAKQATKCELEIGCVKSSQMKKTSWEFSIDPLPASNPFSKCFSFDVLKGTVEAGTTKHVVVTFTPPKESCSLVVSNATLTLKGNSTQVFQLLLRTLISER